MWAQFFTIGTLLLLTAMLPGPDFAIVTKNAVLYSRRAGLWTSFGIASACMIHVTYCMLGLALIISQSVFLFNLIKYIGAIYLIYIGIQSFRSKQAHIAKNTASNHTKKISNFAAFRQGFMCNLFNPKATLFFLALFTAVVKTDIPGVWQIIFAIEMFLIILIWFSTLTFILSHARVLRWLNKAEKFLPTVLGVFLVGFGLALALF